MRHATPIHSLHQLTVVVMLLIGSACTTTETPSPDDLQAAAVGLGDLTVALHESMLLRHDMDRFRTIASDSYVVMIPGGRLETKEEDIAGATNFDIDSVSFSDVTVRTHSASAVVTGTWSVVGRLRTQEMSGKYNFMSVYERTDDSWTLVAESVTRQRPTMAAALTG